MLGRSKVKALQEFQRQKFQLIEDFILTQESKGAPLVGTNNTLCSVSGVNRSTAIPCQKAPRISERSFWFVFGTLVIGSKASTTNSHEMDKKMAKSEDLYVRLMTWFSQWALEMFTAKSYGRWQYTFRSYRIFTFDDPIYTVCSFGDMELVHRLYVEGKATPYDTTCDGWTLLHVSSNPVMEFKKDI